VILPVSLRSLPSAFNSQWPRQNFGFSSNKTKITHLSDTGRVSKIYLIIGLFRHSTAVYLRDTRMILLGMLLSSSQTIRISLRLDCERVFVEQKKNRCRTFGGRCREEAWRDACRAPSSVNGRRRPETAGCRRPSGRPPGPQQTRTLPPEPPTLASAALNGIVPVVCAHRHLPQFREPLKHSVRYGKVSLNFCGCYE